mmetsp:Transcript_30105/g.74694  ORF Transcript_30105/g.74694 Transcript_30105/m.74694 type:complete len:304 (+) Transcript_30105:150-1061(+)
MLSVKYMKKQTPARGVGRVFQRINPVSACGWLFVFLLGGPCVLLSPQRCPMDPKIDYPISDLLLAPPPASPAPAPASAFRATPQSVDVCRCHLDEFRHREQPWATPRGRWRGVIALTRFGFDVASSQSMDGGRGGGEGGSRAGGGGGSIASPIQLPDVVHEGFADSAAVRARSPSALVAAADALGFQKRRAGGARVVALSRGSVVVHPGHEGGQVPRGGRGRAAGGLHRSVHDGPRRPRVAQLARRPVSVSAAAALGDLATGDGNDRVSSFPRRPQSVAIAHCVVHLSTRRHEIRRNTTPTLG